MLTSPCTASEPAAGRAQALTPQHSTARPCHAPRKPPVTWRHALLVLGLAGTTAAALAAEPGGPPAVQVLVWSAGDCGPCRLWHEGERQTEFTQAARAWGAGLLSVRKPSLKDPATAFVWPEATQMHGQTWVRHLPAPRLLPHFDILCRGRPMGGLNGMSGLGDWDSFWHARLRQALRDCQALAG